MSSILYLEPDVRPERLELSYNHSEDGYFIP